MARYEVPEPVEVVDRLLWRDAQRLLTRHAEPDTENRCVWCGWGWPCPPRRLAERADAAARRPWQESWTAQYDLTDLQSLPSWHAGELQQQPSHIDTGGFGADRYDYASHPR